MSELSSSDWDAVWLTLRLATCSTLVLLVLGCPIALWLAFSTSRLRPVVNTLVALPLVLPPTVLGFYLLVLLGPAGPIGSVWEALGGERLVFSFEGLVVGSVIYSLPFVVQPLTDAFRRVDSRLLEVAATLGAARLDRFLSVIVPMSRAGWVSAATLGFAHTVGEFGVVLMLGGNIQSRTRVLSIAIYDHVEALDYARAHTLGAIMLGFSFVALLAIYAKGSRFRLSGDS